MFRFKGSPVRRNRLRLICRAILVILIIILGIGSLSMRDVTYQKVETGKESIPGAFVLVVIDALSIGDINNESMPNLTGLAQMGAIGLMNARTAKTQQPEHAYITIGAGTRAQGPVEAGYAANAGEPFEGATGFEVYIRNTNEPAPSAGSVVHPYIAAIVCANADLAYEIVPGALGEALRRAGKRTAVFGNSDTLAGPCRYAVSIAMDRQGLVDRGDVGHFMTSERSDFPGGIVSDVRRLQEGVMNALAGGEPDLPKADFIVVESGDTARVEKLWLSGTITEAAYSRARREALMSADTLIAGILESVNLSGSVVMVVVPTPGHEASRAGHLLTPVVIAGRGFSKGILTSQATRRRGLVTNTDVAATVLKSLGVAVPPWILGSEMASVYDPRPVQSVTGLLHRTAVISGMRTGHLKTYVSLLIIVALGLPVLIAAGTGKDCGRRIVPVNSVLLALGAMPLVWLVMPLLTFTAQSALSTPSIALSTQPLVPSTQPLALSTQPLVPSLVFTTLFPASTLCAEPIPSAAPSLSAMFVPSAVPWAVKATDMLGLIPPGFATIVLALFISSVLRVGFTTLEGRFAAMCLITGIVIIVDALAGAGLMKHSVLGYDSIGGARFYGIGNEYMGALIGSLIVGCGLLLDCVNTGVQTRAGQRMPACIILFIFTSGVLVLALPAIGANLGGTFAAIAGFGVAYILFLRKSVTWFQVAITAGLGVLLILIVASMDAAQAGGPLSHWGKTVLWVRESGISVLADAVRRKISMNFKLIRYTIWTKAFLVFIGAFAFIRIRPIGLAQKILTCRPGFASALSACLVAGGISLITNDSGIVSAALVTMYPALVLLGLAWQEVT